MGTNIVDPQRFTMDIKQDPSTNAGANPFGSGGPFAGFGSLFGQPSSVTPYNGPQMPSQFFWGGQNMPQQMQFGAQQNPFGGYGSFGQFGGGFSGINPFQSFFSPFNQFSPQQGFQQFQQQGGYGQPQQQQPINPPMGIPTPVRSGWATRRTAF